MAGLPHYKNSTAAMNNFEPLYKAHFEVIITPPPSISNWNLVLENVFKVDMDTTKLIPEKVTQRYKFATRTYSGGAVEDTSVEITMGFEINLDNNNSPYVLKALRKWTDLIYDPLTGRMSLKKDYIGGPMIVSAFNKQGDIYRQWKFPVIFPITTIPKLDFDYTSNEIFKIEDFKFIADYFEEIIL